jgi:hypothetical protein
MPIYQKRHSVGSFIEPSDNAWHKIPYNDQIANANTEAFDGNSSIKYDRSIGIGDLRQSEEGGGATLKVSRASTLKI